MTLPLRAVQEHNCEHQRQARHLFSLVQQLRMARGGSDADLQLESLRQRLALEKEWEAALTTLSDAFLAAAEPHLDAAIIYAQSEWKVAPTKSRLRWFGLRKTDDPLPPKKPRPKGQQGAWLSGDDSQDTGLPTGHSLLSPDANEVRARLMAQINDASMIIGGLQAYLGMALQTSESAGTYALKRMGLQQTWAWAHPQNMARDLFAVRGSKIVQNMYGEHMTKLSEIIARATDPRNPMTMHQVKAEIKTEWPALRKHEVERIARTETAAVWMQTSANAYLANGISEFESTIAHGPSIGIISWAPCDLCVEATGGTRSLSVDLPPYHPNCRCEISPVLEDEFGNPWLPPDEPFTGGGSGPDMSVCGSVKASRGRDQRTRLIKMGAVLKAAGPGCLIPSPPPGEAFGGNVYETVPAGEDSLAQQALASVRSEVDNTWAFEASRNAARELIDSLKSWTQEAKAELLTQRDAGQHLSAFAGVVRHKGASMIVGTASDSGGARILVRRLAQTAVDKGESLFVDSARVSPQMQKLLKQWGFKGEDGGVWEATSADMKLKMNITETAEHAHVAPTVEPVAHPTTPPPPPASMDELKAKLYSANNRISGLKTRLKKLKAKQEAGTATTDDLASLTDVRQRLDKELADRDELKKQIAGGPPSAPAPKAPAPETPPVAAEPTPPPAPIQPPPAPADPAALNAWEHDQITGGVPQDVERGAVFRDGHLVKEYEGDATSVGAEDTQPGDVFTHTHPTIAEVETISLSDADINTAGMKGLKEVRAVNDWGKVSLRTADGSNLDYRVVKDWNAEARLAGKEPEGISRAERLRIQEEYRESTAAENGLVYEKEPNAPTPTEAHDHPYDAPPDYDPEAETKRAAVPGGTKKEKGTAALTKPMTQAAQNPAGSKRIVQDKILARLQNDKRWEVGTEPQYVPGTQIAVAGTAQGGSSRVISEAFRYNSGGDAEVVRNLVHNWAITSSDADARGLAMQIATQEELGLSVKPFAASYWNNPEAGAKVFEEAQALLAKPGVRDALRAFVRAQYDETQAFLKELGVDEITVYRGMRIGTNHEWPVGVSVIDVKDNPMASWSVKHSVSHRSHFYAGTMLRASVPREMVFSTPLTGFGCSNEFEVVVLNDGRNKAWVGQSGSTTVTPERRVELQADEDRLVTQINEKKQSQSEVVAARHDIWTQMVEIRQSGSNYWQDDRYLSLSKEHQELGKESDKLYKEQRLLENRQGEIGLAKRTGRERWSYTTEADLKKKIQLKLDEDHALAGKPLKAPSRPRAEGGAKAPSALTPEKQARNKVSSLRHRLKAEQMKLGEVSSQYENSVYLPDMLKEQQKKIAELQGKLDQAVTDLENLLAGGDAPAAAVAEAPAAVAPTAKPVVGLTGAKAETSLTNYGTTWGKELTVQQRNALSAYQKTSGDYNAYLRTGKTPNGVPDHHVATFMERLKSEIASVDQALASASLPDAVTVMRGISDPNAVFNLGEHGDLSSLVGTTYTDKGFTSTTLDKKVAEYFKGESNANGAVLEITVPKGAHAGWMQIAGVNDAGESELLLARNSKFKVTGVTPKSNGTIIHVELLP